MCRLTQKDEQGNWCVKGLEWEQLHVGQVITQNVWEKLYGALWKLVEYEGTGLTPERIEELNGFEKTQTAHCLAALQEEQRKHRWIPVEERLPTENEYRAICSAHSSKPFLRRIEIVYIMDTTEYQFGYYDGYKWIDKRNKELPNVVAWKIHEPFNPIN